MAYVFSNDHHILAASRNHTAAGNGELQNVYAKFLDIHKTLYPRIRNHSLDLHPRWQKAAIVSSESAASTDEAAALSLVYFRSREQAEMVERLMGKEPRFQTGQVDTYRHPVIELRLTPHHFAIELILSPYAWWDQQNLIGKLELPGHQTAFRHLLSEMDRDYRFGFWGGTGLSEVHLTNGELLRGRNLDEWMDTFTDGQDWLRIGRWYFPGDMALDSERALNEIFNTVKALHRLYNFLLWTGNNNFQAFYERRQRQMRRLYA